MRRGTGIITRSGEHRRTRSAFGRARFVSRLNKMGATVAPLRCSRADRPDHTAKPESGVAVASGVGRRGLTLFEVVLSLAIFVAAMVVIGRMVSTGVRGAVQGRLQSQAVLRCQSKLSEIVAGLVPLRSVEGTEFPDDSSWKWSLAVSNSSQANLYIAEVTVSHEGRDPASQVSFKLRRMLRDPQLFVAAAEAEQQAAQQAQSSSSSSSSGGSP